MAVILVTGSHGQLGSEIKTLARNYSGYEFIFTDIDTLDITNKESVDNSVLTIQPDWIINCVAYNFVDKAESEPDKAFLVNSNAVHNIVDAIKGSDCRLIHVSTDYVFDGKANMPYDENSPANPISVYGRSKLEGEKFALSHPAAMIIRTSWLYSSFGNNFVKTILRLGSEREALNIVFDQTGTPTYAADLAAAIVSVISGVIKNQISFYAGIYNYSNEGVCSWYDFASEIVRASNLNCKVRPILTSGYPTAAQRPAYSVLDKSKIKENYEIEIPHWRTSLMECLKLMI